MPRRKREQSTSAAFQDCAREVKALSRYSWSVHLSSPPNPSRNSDRFPALEKTTIDERPLRNGKVRKLNSCRPSTSLDHEFGERRRYELIDREKKRLYRARRAKGHGQISQQLGDASEDSTRQTNKIRRGFGRNISSSKQHLAFPGINRNAKDPVPKPSLKSSHPPNETNYFPHLDTALLVDQLPANLIESNKFYSAYRNSRPLPTISGENLIECSNFEAFNVPADKWNDDHVMALRVVPFTDLRVEQIFPSETLVEDDDIRNLMDVLGGPTLEDLETTYTLESKNPITDVLSLLHLMIRNSESRDSEARGLFLCLIQPIITQAGKTLSESLTVYPYLSRPQSLYPHSGWSLPCTGFVQFGPPKGSVQNKTPIISLTTRASNSFAPGPSLLLRQNYVDRVLKYASDPNARRVSRRASKKDIHYASGCPYKSVHLEGSSIPTPTNYPRDIGLMMNQISKNNSIRDQEAFVISMAFTRVRVSAGIFPEDLLRAASSASPCITGLAPAVLMQSEEYDLALPQGRRDAVRSIAALIRYLASGKAKVAVLQKNLERSVS